MELKISGDTLLAAMGIAAAFVLLLMLMLSVTGFNTYTRYMEHPIVTKPAIEASK